MNRNDIVQMLMSRFGGGMRLQPGNAQSTMQQLPGMFGKQFGPTPQGAPPSIGSMQGLPAGGGSAGPMLGGSAGPMPQVPQVAPQSVQELPGMFGKQFGPRPQGAPPAGSAVNMNYSRSSPQPGMFSPEQMLAQGVPVTPTGSLAGGGQPMGGKGAGAMPPPVR